MTTSGQSQTLLTKSYLKHPYIRIFFLFLLVESFLLTWAWGVRRLVPDYYPEGALELYQGVAIQTNPWLEPWQRWDTPHYQAIAERGFTPFEMAYFPIYPFLMRIVSPLIGGNTLVAGLIISSLAFLGSLLLIYKLAFVEFGDPEKAMRSVIYMAFFPSAFFLAAAYNESLFLLFTMLCFYFLYRKNWLIAGLFAGVASLTRVPGVLLAIPLGFEIWNSRKKDSKMSWLSLGMMGLVLSGYYLYQWIDLGQLPTATIAAQNQRGGYLAIPGLNIFETIKRIFIGQMIVENSIELFFTLAFIAFAILIWKKQSRLYGLYSISMMIFFLTRMGSPQPLISMVRYTIEIFPVFFLFAQWGTKPAWNRVILYLSWLGLLFFTAQFAIWGWVG